MAALSCRHLVFGHDPSAFGRQGSLGQLHAGRMFLIDAGMSPAVNDSLGALLLIDHGAGRTVVSVRFPGGQRETYSRSDFMMIRATIGLLLCAGIAACGGSPAAGGTGGSTGTGNNSGSGGGAGAPGGAGGATALASFEPMKVGASWNYATVETSSTGVVVNGTKSVAVEIFEPVPGRASVSAWRIHTIVPSDQDQLTWQEETATAIVRHRDDVNIVETSAAGRTESSTSYNIP